MEDLSLCLYAFIILLRESHSAYLCLSMHTYSHSHAYIPVHWPFSSKDSAELNAVKWWASCHVPGEKVNMMLEVLLNQMWPCDFVLRENEWQTRERQSHVLIANDSEKPQTLHLKGFKVFGFVFLENNGVVYLIVKVVIRIIFLYFPKLKRHELVKWQTEA